jgi:single-stranded DNA-binding protein
MDGHQSYDDRQEAASMTITTVPALEHRNEVHLIGRVSRDPTLARLPSGDLVVNVQVVVERPRPPAGRGRRQKVDTLSCAAWEAGLQRTVMRWCKNDIVEVRGALHRRFWRGDGVPQSRYEVELSEARRLYHPPPPPEEVNAD